jgi:outer membrane immunogenic protein
MKKLLLGAGAALLLMTSNAIADGMPRRAPTASVCCVPNWTGFYIGVGVGGAFTTNDISAKAIEERKDYWGNTTVDVFRIWDLENGRSHAFGTVTAGYDHQFAGHWVAGIFADYDFGNGKNNSRILELGPLYDIHQSNENRHAWSIGGRLGFLSSPNTLLYISTGYTQVSLDREVSFWFNDTFHRGSFDKERDGWFIGAGIETQLAWLRPGLSLRGEYRFTRLNDDHRKLDLGESYCYYCTLNTHLEFDHDTDVHSVRVVLAYKFGRREEVAPLK